jgi:hypothetical protein
MAADAKPKTSANSGASGSATVSHFNHWWVWVLLGLAVVVVAVGVLSSGSSSGSGAKAKVVESRTVTKSLTVELSPTGWTRWVTEIPPTASFYFTNQAGWVRVEFWNREQVVWETGEVRWDERKLPQGNFRLKGVSGTATIYWEEPR